jgi:hypothetical protein
MAIALAGGCAGGPGGIALAKNTTLRLPAGLEFVAPPPGDPDMLGTVVDRSSWVAHRLVFYAVSRDERGVPQVEAAGWRR